MSTILFAWELGGGLGHITTIKPLAEGLSEQGHRVLVALKNFAHASRVFQADCIEYLPSPSRVGPIANYFQKTSTFPHILHNCGFGDAEELRALASGWRTLFDLVQPDLLVADHSPTALLAARCFSFRRATLGAGFWCPAVCHPYPDWRPEFENDPQALLEDERRVVEHANAVLDSWEAQRIGRLSDLYSQVDQTLLITYPELDPFGQREGAEYWGSWPQVPGETPEWPPGESPRVFAYLKSFPELRALLSELRDRRLSTIVSMTGVPEEIQAEFSCSNICWSDKLIDIQQAAGQCDVGITHGTHGLTASMLLAGRPVLMLPQNLEQRLTAHRVIAMGAGRAAVPNNPTQISKALGGLLADDRHYVAAEQFAAKHRATDRQLKLDRAVRLLGELAGRP